MDLAKSRRQPRELDRRRYPPTGDPDLWVTYGPAGPPGWPMGEMLMCRQVDHEAAQRWARTGISVVDNSLASPIDCDHDPEDDGPDTARAPGASQQ